MREEIAQAFQLSWARDLDLGSGHTILNTVMHHSSTPTYIPNVIEIEETFCGRTDGWADRHFTHTALGLLGGVNLKIAFTTILQSTAQKNTIFHGSTSTLHCCCLASCLLGWLPKHHSSVWQQRIKSSSPAIGTSWPTDDMQSSFSCDNTFLFTNLLTAFAK